MVLPYINMNPPCGVKNDPDKPLSKGLLSPQGETENIESCAVQDSSPGHLWLLTT